MTRPQDAVAAARAGADAIGLVFYAAARRRVTVDRAREIIDVLPPFVTPVGLFVDSAPSEILEVARHLGIRQVQLHGHEAPELVAALNELTVLKAVRVTRDGLTPTLQRWRSAIHELRLHHLKGLLLETASTTAPGGTGVENDWDTIAEFQRAGAFDGLPPIIAAGGLRPENVGDVVRRLRPWAVDVSSGVEESSGAKSQQKLTAFAQAVHDGDQQLIDAVPSK